ncbi:hypothetical protein FC36_GL000707 [Ligilactobacillus equi DSM 15833 = JCM 10991]|nr:hypothetical protein FC36_GL000707 [Ligilactobacillus equi DSM 15833 = JCM 10991]
MRRYATQDAVKKAQADLEVKQAYLDSLANAKDYNKIVQAQLATAQVAKPILKQVAQVATKKSFSKQ